MFTFLQELKVFQLSWFLEDMGSSYNRTSRHDWKMIIGGEVEEDLSSRWRCYLNLLIGIYIKIGNKMCQHWIEIIWSWDLEGNKLQYDSII